jgi:Tfp pilus assembly protein PilX
MIALIVLIGMTLAGIALMRSVDTSNIIAGNLAFQQAATQSADAGTEGAIAWLQLNSSSLQDSVIGSGQGYYAVKQNLSLVTGQSWENLWQSTVAPGGINVFNVTFSNGTLTDAAGNSVSYVIDRLCTGTGSPTSPSSGCAKPAGAGAVSADSNSNDSGGGAYVSSNQVYYRITTRVQGPRNSVSFIQTVIAL